MHPPSVYDFRKKPWFPGPISRTVHFTPVFTSIPIGFISMADYIEKRGYKVKIINLAEYMATNLKFDVEKYIKNINSEYFAIDLHFCVHSQGAIKIAQICKELHDNSKIIFGGLTATAFSRELMKNYPFIDYTIKGEGEVPILRLLEEKNIEKVPNILFRKNNHIFEKNISWIAPDLNDYDFSRIDLIEPRNLLTTIPTELGPKKHWMIPICRGCLYNCITCGGSKYSYKKLLGREKLAIRNVDKIVEDLQRLSEKGIESVFLFMDPRLAGKKYWEKLLKELISNKCDIKYLTLELFTPGSREFLTNIAYLNNFIRVGLSISPESGNDSVRNSQGRLYSTQNLLRTADFCRENGLGLVVFFMSGLAEDTKNSYEDTYKLIEDLLEKNFELGSGPGIRTHFGEMLLMDPGSLAFDNPDKYGYKLYFKNLRDYINGMSSLAWTDWLSFETKYFSRKEILEQPIQLREKIIKFYYSKGLISKEQAELQKSKIKLDKIIIYELEKISLLNESYKEEQYRELYNALNNYDLGKISLKWRIKRKLKFKLNENTKSEITINED
jgi:B12-binding domain/radical SAM domain protein